MTRRRLDQELVRRGLVSSREEAQEAIAALKVTVGGAVAEKAARQVAPGEPIEFLGPTRRFVSRAGEKLDHALDKFQIGVTGTRCLDIGASTGGFSQCLLQHGAAHVYAVDVGHGQLHQRVREDPRVTVHEGVNARQLELGHVGGGVVDVVVADVSFISLRKINAAAIAVAHADAEFIYLIKPQFEARKTEVGRGGIVSDPRIWFSVVSGLDDAFFGQGLCMVALVPSPIRGTEGNVEFLAHLRKSDPSGRLSTRDIEAIVRSVES